MGVGSLLMIPFSGRRILGVVVDVAAESDLPPERLAEPLEAIEAGATPELVGLGLWVAERYCSTASRGLALVLPPGSGTGKKPRTLKPLTERRAAITDAGREALAADERLGTKQRAALERLAADGELSGSQLKERAGADSVVLGRLAERGLVEQRIAEVRRAPRIDVGRSGRRRTAAALRPPGGLRRRARSGPRRRGAIGAAAPRRDRLRQDRGLSRRDRGDARARAQRDPARARDRPDPADARAGRGPARRSGRGDPLRALGGGALRRVAPAPLRGRAGLRRPALRRLRAAVGPRPDRRRRGARLLLQAGGRSALRRPSGRPGTAPPRPAPSTSPARRRRGPRAGPSSPGSSCPSGSTACRCRPSRSSTCARCPGSAGPLHPVTREALSSLRETAGDGAKAIVMLNRRGFSPHLSCGSCGAAVLCPNCDVSLVLHRGRDMVGCHHCGHTEPVPRTCAGVRLGLDLSARRRHRADRAADRRARRAGARRQARRRHDGRARGGHAERPHGLRAGRRRRPRRDADGRQGPRLPRRRAQRPDRRRLDPALPGLPGRGANVRARLPARRPQRPGRSRRARPRPDAGADRGADRGGGRSRRRRLPGRRARAAPGVRLPALLVAAGDRAGIPRRGRAGRGRRADRAHRAARARAGGGAARPGAAIPAARPLSPPPADQDARAGAGRGGRAGGARSSRGRRGAAGRDAGRRRRSRSSRRP